eukprot:tig00000870_g5140.t1
MGPASPARGPMAAGNPVPPLACGCDAQGDLACNVPHTLEHLPLPLPLPAFLVLAEALAERVFAFHDGDHRSLLLSALRPWNVSVRFTRGGEGAEVVLNDHSVGGNAVAPSPRRAAPELEAFSYTAPELTGRVGSLDGADERSDLYLLGILLYECATGRRPFTGSTPIELIHAHLAKRPTRVTHLNTAYPEVVGAVIERLLAKTPRDRYQSAYGLLQDLTRCRELLKAEGTVPGFVLGSNDPSARLVLPEAPCGRSDDVQRALDACRRVKESRRPALVVVSGPPGAGKTFTVREIGRRAEAAGLASRFLAGKVDQYNRVPFAMWFRALGDLVCQLLAAPTAEVGRWRAALLAALQGNARLLVDVVPAAKLLLGSGLAPLPEVSPAESQARLRACFTELLRVVAGPAGPPLVVLLDDCQWVERETIALAEHVLASDLPVLLCVTYRSCEVGEGHIAAEFVQRATRSVPVETLPLEPMDLSDARELVVTALKVPNDEAVARLAAALLRKSSGNPLHTLQFLRILYERRVLRFNHPLGRWSWDQAAVDAIQEGDTVAEMVALSILALPPDTQHALRVASCCGSTFDVAMLSTIIGAPEEEITRAVQPALLAGLIVGQARPAPPRPPPPAPRARSLGSDGAGGQERAGGVEGPGAAARGALALPSGSACAMGVPAFLSFHHDKIQQRLTFTGRGRLQAAHDTIEEGEKAALCFRAGMLLRAAMPNPAEAENLYEVANLLNTSLAAPPAAAGRHDFLAIARLDLLAARRARSCTAFARGGEYALAGLRAISLAGTGTRPEIESEGGGAAERCACRGTEAGCTAPPHVPGPRELEFCLVMILAECEYLSGDYAGAESRFPSAWRLATCAAERLSVYRLEIAFLSTRGQFRRSLEVGLVCMRSLWDVDLSLDATFDLFLAEMDDVVAALDAARPDRGGAFKPSDLVDVFSALPPCTDRRMLELMQVGAEAALSAVYGECPALFGLIPARCLKLSLEHGRAPETALLAGVLGHVCAATDATLRYSLPLATVAARFGDHGDLALRAKSLVWRCCSSIWAESFVESLGYAEASFRASMQLGDLVCAYRRSGLATMCALLAALWAGESLPLLHRRASAVLQFVRTRQPTFVVLSSAWVASSRLLQTGVAGEGDAGLSPLELATPSADLAPGSGLACGRLRLDAERYRSDVASLPCWAKGMFTASLVTYALAMGDYLAAWRIYEEFVGPHTNVDILLLREGYSAYQDTLTALSIAIGTRLSPGPGTDCFDAEAPLGEGARAALVERLAGYCDSLGVFAGVAPQNYAFRHLLVRAELARARGETAGAMEGYERAADAAEAAGVLHIAALACERLGTLALGMGLRRTAAGHLRAAARAFEARGAAPPRPAPGRPDICSPAGVGRAPAGGDAPGHGGRRARRPRLRLPRGARRLRPRPSEPQRRPETSSGSGSRSRTVSKGTSARDEERDPSLRAQPASGSAAASGATTTAGATGRRGGGDSAREAALERGGTEPESNSEGDTLNWETLAFASQCISREIEIAKVLEQLMTVLLEISGGERGFLVLEKDNSGAPEQGAKPGSREGAEYLIEAMGEVVQTSQPPRPGANASLRIDVLQGLPLAECGELLCVRAVDWAVATEATALLQDCSRREENYGIVAGDAYVERAGVKSLLAFPVMHQARAIGCVYLENRLLRGAFPPASIDMLRILSSQMAISIVNARLYERLRKSCAEHAAVLANAHDSIVIVDEAGRIVAANPASERLWDQSCDELAGRRLEELLSLTGPQEQQEEARRQPSQDEPEREEGPEEERGPLRSPLEQLLGPSSRPTPAALGKIWNGFGLCARGRVEVEVCFTALEEEAGASDRGDSGRSSPSSSGAAIASLAPPAGPGPGGVRRPSSSALDSKRYAVFVRDISARLQAERRLQQIHRRWFCMMTHDLRTPLNGILGMYELLSDTKLSLEQREYVRQIGASADVLLSLMDDILEYSRLEEGVAEARPAPFDLLECLEETVSMVAISARSKEIDLLLLLPPDLPTRVVGESVRFRRVVMNYLSNAVKFTQERGRVELRVSATPEGPGRARFRVTVKDNGIGIPKAQQHLLFRAYGQVQGRGASRMFAGTGLGLAIARRLAEAMGGGAGVVSEEGKGAEFWADALLALQAPRPPSSPRPRRLNAAQEEGPPGARPGRRGVAAAGGGALRAGPARRLLRRRPRALPRAVGRRVVRGRPRGRGGAGAGEPCALLLSDDLEALGLAGAGAPASPASASASASASAVVAVFASEAAAAGAAGAAVDGVVLPVRPSQLARALLSAMRRSGREPPGLEPPLSPSSDPEAAAALALAACGSPPPTPTSAAAMAGAPGARILLVDDIKTNLLLAKKMLESAGHSVKTAENGEQCIAMFSADPGAVDLILLDVEMPVCDGREACLRIRELEAGPLGRARAGPVPIVFLTANAMPEDREEALRLGASGFTTKPIRRQVLLEAVARHLRGPEGPRHPPSPSNSAAGGGGFVH